MAFTDRGYALGEDLCRHFYVEEGFVAKVERIASGTLYETAALAWKEGYDLIFIGAVGIAVRAIAGLVDSKLGDRAVVVADETGRYVIPILSGHVGGADRLAKRIAKYTGGEAVITSASAQRGVEPFDEWAAKNGFAILNKERIAPTYDKIFAGDLLRVCRVDYEGEVPFGKYEDSLGISRTAEDMPDVIIYGGTDMREITGLMDDFGKASLIMAARFLIAGVGCKRGTSAEQIEGCIREACEKGGLDTVLLGALATIDLKADEEGILSACARNRWKLYPFSAEQLKEVKGDFASSAFVEQTVGVDNVCERAAVRAGGRLLVGKSVYTGVTVAIAERIKM